MGEAIAGVVAGTSAGAAGATGMVGSTVAAGGAFNGLSLVFGIAVGTVAWLQAVSKATANTALNIVLQFNLLMSPVWTALRRPEFHPMLH
jgi:hypothetical protein